MDEIQWLMLNYTLPKEPSRIRVSAWRKLKKCGSISIGQSMWVLPMSQDHIDIFTEISNDILQNNGEAYIMKTTFMSQDKDQEIIRFFNKASDEEYKELLEKCNDFFAEIEKETQKENFTYIEVEENEYEYNKMIEWYQKISQRDFFTASLKVYSKKELEKCKVLLEEFSDKVYEINDKQN